jgi:hypothetical protein
VNACPATALCDPGTGSCIGADDSGAGTFGNFGDDGGLGSGTSPEGGFGEGGTANGAVSTGASGGCGCLVVDTPGSNALAAAVSAMLGISLWTRRRRRR